MPLNESTGQKRPQMTPQQIRDAERALFGPAPQDERPEPERNKLQTFDLNNPPKHMSAGDTGSLRDPYRYEEFPRMVFLHGDPAQFKIAQNVDQLEVAMMRGYTTEVAEAESEAESYQLTADSPEEEHDDEAYRAYLAEQQAAAAPVQDPDDTTGRKPKKR